MIDLICKNTSTRLDYILDYLSNCLGHKLVQTQSFTRSSQAVVQLNYTNEAHEDSIRIYNSGFLFSTGLSECEQLPDVQHKEQVQLFRAEKDRYHINFDLLSAIFFCLSRYEEYCPFQADTHGRFSAAVSHAFKHDYLAIPVVDQWVNFLKSEIAKQSRLSFKHLNEFEIFPTIDVDSAWAFQHRSVMHATGSMVRNIMTMQWDRIREKQKAQKNKLDPYDRYDYLQTRLQGLNPVYFFLMHFQRPYDTAHYSKRPVFSELIRRIDEHSAIGMHPSYASNDDVGQLRREQQQLSQIVNRPITKSRQHFLKVSLPDTYQRLIELGIEEDYSMGFGDQIGFRAGTSRPFKWYNLATESITPLTIHPFCIMDVTLKEYMSLSPGEAMEEISILKQTIRKEEGRCSFIWHNSSFAEMDGWAGWESVFELLLTS